jgi:hypothetical protein
MALAIPPTVAPTRRRLPAVAGTPGLQTRSSKFYSIDRRTDRQ